MVFLTTVSYMSGKEAACQNAAMAYITRCGKQTSIVPNAGPKTVRLRDSKGLQGSVSATSNNRNHGVPEKNPILPVFFTTYIAGRFILPVPNTPT